ncbi:hypothetical protein BQ8794_90107 [Mesorhizobium prunaredense]|uniref:Uncharacterized protein n=1 Tax=Mesorhizobium prunaredense TaxID=1631249 RepID=A0A1R3VM20_9HYPH|nr:hypothetical protein BQ8794_90107 [Mesorhizobium prunaredense]
MIVCNGCSLWNAVIRLVDWVRESGAKTGRSAEVRSPSASGVTCSFWQMSRTAASPRDVRDIRIAAASNGLMSRYLVLEQAIVLRSLVGTVLPLGQRGCKCRFVSMSIPPS